MIIVAAPGNPASPAYFKVSPLKEGHQLSGEGTGNKSAADSACRDLNELSDKDIATLVVQTKQH
jgi:hypothetical protein